MIQSFRCKETAKIWRLERSRKLPEQIQQRALDKLRLLNAATQVEELASSPGNRLEALKGAREGRYSIRINNQWRICFVWRQGQPHEVEIVDYY